MPAVRAQGRGACQADEPRRQSERGAAGFNPVIANQPGQGQQQQLAAVQAQLAALQAVPGQLAQVLATQAQVLANQGQMLASLADLQAGQAQLRAQQGNDRLRLHNTRMQNAVGPPPLLAPLAKEQLPPAGAAAPGTLPPPNIFPATWTAVQQLNNAALNALSVFYGVQFGPNNGGGLAARRKAFSDFITS